MAKTVKILGVRKAGGKAFITWNDKTEWEIDASSLKEMSDNMDVNVDLMKKVLVAYCVRANPTLDTPSAFVNKQLVVDMNSATPIVVS